MILRKVQGHGILLGLKILGNLYEDLRYEDNFFSFLALQSNRIESSLSLKNRKFERNIY